MNKLILGCAILALTIGCARIRYDDEGFTYTRIGKQSTEGIEVTKLDDGSVEFKMGKQSGDSGNLKKVLADIAKVAAGAAGGATK